MIAVFQNSQALPKFRIAGIALLLVTALRVFLLNDRIVNPDCAMYLQTAKQVLLGHCPFVDFVEINPPFVFYFNLPFAILSRIFLLPADQALYIGVFAFIALSFFFADRILKQFQVLNGDTDSIHTIHTDSALLVAFAVANFIAYEWGQFGQRQHFLSIALLPYFLLRRLKAQHGACATWISFCCGLFIGLTLIMMPHYALLFIAIEAFCVLQRGSFRAVLCAEWIGLILSLGIAFIELAVIPEAGRHAFFTRWLPMVSQGYSVYNWPYQTILAQVTLTGVVPLCLLSVLFARPFFAGKWNLTTTAQLSILSGLALLVVVLQGKALLNQMLPFLFTTIFLAFTVFSRDRTGKTSFARCAWTLPVVLLFLELPLFTITLESVTHTNRWHAATNRLESSIRENSKDGDSVSIFSSALPDSYPCLLNLKRENASRFFFLFPLKLLEAVTDKHKGDASEQRWIREKERFAQDILEDLAKNQPDLILLQEPASDDSSPMVRQLFESHPGLKKELSSWQRIGQVEGVISPLTLFRRQPGEK